MQTCMRASIASVFLLNCCAGYVAGVHAQTAPVFQDHSPLFETYSDPWLAQSNPPEQVGTPLFAPPAIGPPDPASSEESTSASQSDASSASSTEQNNTNRQTPDSPDDSPGFTSDIADPVVALRKMRQRREVTTDRYALFRTSPLTPLRERIIQCEKDIYEETDIKFGTNINTLFQGLGNNIQGTDSYGMASFLQYVATWDGYRKGQPNQGELTIGVEGRWNWGTTDPTTLGNVGLGSLTFTSNPFTTYTPTFLVRNLFWRQGSREAGWMYRIGRVTPDQFLQTSANITPLTTFLPIAGTGAFAMGLPDSGLGMFGGIFVNDRVNLVGVVTDANADRTNFGELDEGDLFTAVELQAKILPFTDKAGYSKVTFWHNDGTQDGTAINGSTGLEGWGVFFKLEQELTRDGRLIGIGRWGRSYKQSALYEQQAAAHLVFYDPFCTGSFRDTGLDADLAGVAYNWVQPTGVDRDESNVELFYRFPLFPQMDASLSYQGIINPALNPSSDYGSAVSLRLRSSW